MAELGKIYVRVGADLTSFEKAMTKLETRVAQATQKLQSLEKVGKVFSDVGSKLSKGITAPLAAVGGALSFVAVKSSYAADRLADLTEITGLTVEAIQEWEYVAVKAGVKTEAFADAITGLVRRMGTAESGSATFEAALQKLGLSMDEIKKMSPDEMLTKMVTLLAQMDDKLERNVIGYQLFGRAWQEIAPMFALGAKGIIAARKEAEKLGLVLSGKEIDALVKVRQAFDLMKATLQVVFMKVTVAIGPIIVWLGNLLIKLLKPISDVIKWFGNMPPVVQKFATVLGMVLASIGPLLMALGGLVKSIYAVNIALAALGTTFNVTLGWLGLLISSIAVAIIYWNKLVGALVWGIGEIIQGFGQLIAGLSVVAKAFDFVTFGLTDASGELVRFAGKIGLTAEKLKDYASAMFEVGRATKQLDTSNILSDIKKTTKEFDKLQSIVGDNIQSFDEIHKVGQKAGMNVSVDVSGLGDLEDAAQAMKDMSSEAVTLDGTVFELSTHVDDWLNPALVDVTKQMIKTDDNVSLVASSFDSLQFTVNGVKSKLDDFSSIQLKMDKPIQNIEDLKTTFQDLEQDTDKVADSIQDKVPSTFDDMSNEILDITSDMTTTTLDDFSTMTEGVLEETGNMYDEVVGHSIIPDMVEAILEQWGLLGEGTDEHMQQISQTVVNGAQTIENSMTSAARNINKSWNQNMRDMVEKTLTEYYPQFVAVMGYFGITAKDMARTIAREFQSAGKDITKELKNWIQGSQDFSTTMQNIWGRLGQVVENVATTIVTQMITSSLTGLATWLSAQLAAAGEALIGWLTEAFWALTAWYAWAGPAAPELAAATIGAGMVAVGALAWAGYEALQGLVKGLATGGIVTGPTLAVLGEGGKQEAVIPLERDNVIAKSVGEAVYNAMTATKGGTGSNGTVVLEIDGYEFARAILPYLNDEIVRSGVQLGEV